MPQKHLYLLPIVIAAMLVAISAPVLVEAQQALKGQGAKDAILLDCKWQPNGPGAPNVVVMRRLKTVRVWFGDGGGIEWTDVDFSRGKIDTYVEKDGRAISLSSDLNDAIFLDGTDRNTGRCVRIPVPAGLERWVEPRLRQPWEKLR